MKLHIIMLYAALFVPTVIAQAPSPKPVVQEPTTAPQLTATEKLAIATVKQEFSQSWSDLKALSTDIAREHPGYHLNSDTGVIEKDAPPPQPAPTVKK